ncbi:MAG: hypothetical protein CSA81_08240 [Acidobacteria bacterium]|nr:MAG: hypothetical protein CSA81_08240 [Acidobacteriota bacterium]PIE89714.1 MAG: hypothetical protein CR997_09775 [Acidobacteriota bacterium]
MSKLSGNKFTGDPQNIIAVGVIVISLCALIVSVIQTSLLHEEREMMREYSRASVWPHLEFDTLQGQNKENGKLNRLQILLTNRGVGPAIITDVRVSYQDSVANNWWHLFDIMEIPDTIEKYIGNITFNNRVIKIGETIKVLDLDNNLPLANAFAEKLKQKGRFSIEIYYKSIYGEQWKNHNGTITKLENFKGLPKEEQFY